MTLLKTKPELMGGIGTISLTIALLLSYFGSAIPLVDLFAGMFMGISITLNLAFLITFRLRNDSIPPPKNQKIE